MSSADQDQPSRSGGAGLLGPFRDRRLGAAIGTALTTARRRPLATMLIAVGAGWLIQRMRNRLWLAASRERFEGEAGDIPVLNTGQARIYDPDASPRHPTQDSLESRREMNARI